MFKIYVIINLRTGEQYVGQTKQPQRKRFLQHIYNAQVRMRSNKLSVDIRTFGEECFRIYTIEENIISQIDADEAEAFWISKIRPEYNHFSGGKTKFKLDTQSIIKQVESRGEYISLTHRKCVMCKQILPKDMFYNNRSAWDGKQKSCKTCQKAYVKNAHITSTQLKLRQPVL